MSLRGARGILTVSQNPSCEWLTAIVSDRMEDVDLYEQLTGRPYEGETGQRAAMMRRGRQFEAALYANGASKLRKTLAPLYGYEADEMQVLDFRQVLKESPGGGPAAGLRLMRGLLRQLAEGQQVPHMLLQPQLSLPITPGDTRYITPDFMVLNPGTSMYEVGEIKSFIVRDNEADGLSLERARRQAAVEISALRYEVVRIASLFRRVKDTAVFIFARPQGFTPTQPYRELLSAEVEEVRRALLRLQRMSKKLAKMRANGPRPLWQALGKLSPNYIERCRSICALAPYCKERVQSKAPVLGDAARELFGTSTNLGRIAALLKGAEPVTRDEVELVARFVEAARVLGISQEKKAE